MAQKAAIVIFLGLIFALNSVDCSSEPNIQVDVVHNLNEFLRANPTATLLEPVKNGTSPRLTLTYKTGQRVNGDSLQAQLIDWFTYAAPQDVKATFNYPVSGTGAIVSYIQVDIEQVRGYDITYSDITLIVIEQQF